MAPSGAEVYVDDERYGSVGRSGRVILTSLAPGQHVLRVSKSGEPDDERVIEIRSDIAEQIIEAQLKIGDFKQSIDSVARRKSRQQARRTLDDVGSRDVYEMPFAFCGRSEVLRQVRQHDVSTSFREVSTSPLSSTGHSSTESESHVHAAGRIIHRKNEILRTLWHSHRNGIARLAPAKARRGVLPNVQQQLSCRNQILRALRKADYGLSAR